MNDKFLYLTSKYLAGEITETEREVLFTWVNASEVNKAAFEEMLELWELSGDLEEDFDADVSAAWQKVAKRTISKEAKIIRYPWSRQLLRIAAVIFVVIGAYWLLENWTQKVVDIVYQTADEKTQITLPDGSKVWLNENTKISFAKKFVPRLIRLEGEAFFEVEHLSKDQPFEILSGETKTTVLGTSFNVRAYAEEQRVEVTVETGKVAFEKMEKGEKVKKGEKGKKGKKVDGKNDEVAKIVLNAGDSGVFDKEKRSINIKENKNENANSWKTEQLSFDNTELSVVKETLERYFDIKINTSDEKILNCHFTGVYQKPEIDQILEVLKFSLNIEIIKDQNEFTLTGEGCE
jgi:transmembrane sensor